MELNEKHGIVAFQSPEGGRLGLQRLLAVQEDIMVKFQSPEGGRLGLQQRFLES